MTLCGILLVVVQSGVLGGGESGGWGLDGKGVVDEARGVQSCEYGPALRRFLIYLGNATMSHVSGALLTCTCLSWMCTAPLRYS